MVKTHLIYSWREVYNDDDWNTTVCLYVLTYGIKNMLARIKTETKIIYYIYYGSSLKNTGPRQKSTT